LYYCGHKDFLTHEIELRRCISELYEVRKINPDGSIENVPFDSNSVERVGKLTKSSIDSSMRLSPPEMYGEYLIKSNIEYSQDICETLKQMSNVYLITDCITFESNKKEIVMRDINKSIHTFMWMSQNINNPHNYSNYEDIDNTTIEFNSFKLLDNCPSHITSGQHQSDHFPNYPSNKGFNAWTCGVSYNDKYPIPSHHIKDANMLINYNGERNNFVVLLYHRKIEFTNFPDSEEARKNGKVTISVMDI
jgi:hypothetical protein